eukprot:323043-Pyramimonas_sp.AAC.1
MKTATVASSDRLLRKLQECMKQRGGGFYGRAAPLGVGGFAGQRRARAGAKPTLTGSFTQLQRRRRARE